MRRPVAPRLRTLTACCRLCRRRVLRLGYDVPLRCRAAPVEHAVPLVALHSLTLAPSTGTSRGSHQALALKFLPHSCLDSQLALRADIMPWLSLPSRAAARFSATSCTAAWHPIMHLMHCCHGVLWLPRCHCSRRLRLLTLPEHAPAHAACFPLGSLGSFIAGVVRMHSGLRS